MSAINSFNLTIILLTFKDSLEYLTTIVLWTNVQFSLSS